MDSSVLFQPLIGESTCFLYVIVMHFFREYFVFQVFNR